MKKQSGFSLIELLVVVAIIGFLSAIGMAVYADVQAKGRDTKRKADIDSIAKVLEIHKTDAGGYQPFPSPDTWFGSSGGLPTTDPKGYHYCISSNATGAAIADAIATGVSKTWGDDKNCVTYSNIISGSGAKPAAGDTTWKVCTLLEQAVNGSFIYCRYSVQ